MNFPDINVDYKECLCDKEISQKIFLSETNLFRRGLFAIQHVFLSPLNVILFHFSFPTRDNIHSQFSHFHGIFPHPTLTALSYREVDIHWLLDRTPGHTVNIFTACALHLRLNPLSSSTISRNSGSPTSHIYCCTI